MQEVILVVPCYNEAERFDSGGFADFLAEQPGYALLFVDDGSSDRTPERLEALRKRHHRFGKRSRDSGGRLHQGRADAGSG